MTWFSYIPRPSKHQQSYHLHPLFWIPGGFSLAGEKKRKNRKKRKKRKKRKRKRKINKSKETNQRRKEKNNNKSNTCPSQLNKKYASGKT